MIVTTDHSSSSPKKGWWWWVLISQMCPHLWQNQLLHLLHYTWTGLDKSQITPKYLWNPLSWRCIIPWRSAFHFAPSPRGRARTFTQRWYPVDLVYYKSYSCAWLSVGSVLLFSIFISKHIGFCLVWKWGINPQKGYLNRETNDQPLDLGYTIFKPHMSLAVPLRTPAACHWPCTTRPPWWRCCGMLGLERLES